MKLIKKYISEGDIGVNFSDIVLEMDEYPEEPNVCCKIETGNSKYDLMYIGNKTFKLLSVNDDYSKVLKKNDLKKGLEVIQYECKSDQKK